MKKTVRVLAAFACLSVFLFNSCAQKKVTLKMWESDGPERQFMEWAAAEYKKTHPNIEIVYEPVASPDASTALKENRILHSCPRNTLIFWLPKRDTVKTPTFVPPPP